LVVDALGARIELLAIFFSPPIPQIPFCIELAALVIEAVRQFVPNDGTHRTVIHRIIYTWQRTTEMDTSARAA